MGKNYKKLTLVYDLNYMSYINCLSHINCMSYVNYMN